MQLRRSLWTMALRCARRWARWSCGRRRASQPPLPSPWRCSLWALACAPPHPQPRLPLRKQLQRPRRRPPRSPLPRAPQQQRRPSQRLLRDFRAFSRAGAMTKTPGTASGALRPSARASSPRPPRQLKLQRLPRTRRRRRSEANECERIYGSTYVSGRCAAAGDDGRLMVRVEGGTRIVQTKIKRTGGLFVYIVSRLLRPLNLLSSTAREGSRCSSPHHRSYRSRWSCSRWYRSLPLTCLSLCLAALTVAAFAHHFLALPLCACVTIEDAWEDGRVCGPDRGGPRGNLHW